MDASQDILARLIRCAAPKSDALFVARTLIDTYGSLGPILETATEDLQKTPNMTDAASRILNFIPQLARYALREEADKLPALDTFEKAGAYLRARYVGAFNESFYLLCLDDAGRRIDCSLVQHGTVDEAPFYLRRILELAARNGAYAVVLSHNHPSGTMTPSKPDVQCTMAAIEALLPLGILVLDHILVAGGVPVSMRASGAMPDVLFERQRPGCPLVAGWLPNAQ